MMVHTAPFGTAQPRLPRFSSMLVLLVACNGGKDDHSGRRPVDHAPGLQRFESCDAMRSYMVDAWTETLVMARYGDHARGGVFAVDDAATAGADAGSVESAASGPSDWSETNVQEAGVDEPDMVKTDGEHIYVVHQQELTILSSWPVEDTAVVGRLALAGDPFSMFVEGDRAVVFSHDWSWNGFAEGYGYGDTVLMTVVDLQDRTAPEAVREVRLEGWFADARMVDGAVYTVVNSGTEMPGQLWDLVWEPRLGLPTMRWSASEARRREVRQRARSTYRPYVEEAVAAISTADLLPGFVDGLPGEAPEAEPLLNCTDIYRPNHRSSPNVLSVVHLELDADAPVSATGLMADGWQVYAAEDRLVVSQASSAWWWGEAQPKVVTHLHQFALEGAATVYEASGWVDGWLLNRYALGAHEGYLRVATSDADGWEANDRTPPANNVFVLETNGGSMDVVGEVRGIAPNETIQSARFMGKKGYLVTYEQVDPLFTLDLSEPENPRVAGELKIPGFSTYLHPIDDDHMLSVGYAGTWEGEITGMAVNLFDLTDFANPILADEFTFEGDDWSESEALWNPHAFTYHRGVLSLPLYTYGINPHTHRHEVFSGMLVLDVDTEAGFSALGQVDHAELAADSRCVYDWDRTAPCDDDWWYASMRRSVVIEDHLFSISDYGVKVTELENPDAELARVLFWPL